MVFIMRAYFLSILFLFGFVSASSLQLVAIVDSRCHVCESWEKEVGQYYDTMRKTHGYPELKILNWDSAYTKLWVRNKIGFVTGLPTFVVLSDNEVVGKIRGYDTEEDFYNRLQKLIEKSEQEVAPRDGLEPPTK